MRTLILTFFVTSFAFAAPQQPSLPRPLGPLQSQTVALAVYDTVTACRKDWQVGSNEGICWGTAGAVLGPTLIRRQFQKGQIWQVGGLVANAGSSDLDFGVYQRPSSVALKGVRFQNSGQVWLPHAARLVILAQGQPRVTLGRPAARSR